MTTGVLVAAAYLLGSVPFAFLLARSASGVDLRTTGSGNVGATNVLRTSGIITAVVAAALDAAKGAAAVWLASLTGGDPGARAACGVMAVVGHVYPVWLRFRGGKGVATACGAFAVLAPAATLVAGVAWIAVCLLTRYSSLASIVAAVTLAVVESWMGPSAAVRGAALGTAALVVFRHRDNLSRLVAGTERRLGGQASAR